MASWSHTIPRLGIGLLLWLQGFVHAVAQDAAQLSRLLDAAGAQAKQGNLDQAIATYQQALNHAQSIFGSQHVNVGAIQGTIGDLYRDKGDPAKARQFLEQALQVYERSGDASLRAEGLNNLAAVCVELADYLEARRLHESSLALMKQQFGAQSPQVGVSLSNLSVVYRALGQESAAENLLQQSIAMLNRGGDKHSLSLASAYLNLANIYQSAGDILKAEPMYVEAIRLVESRLGVNAVEAARIRNNLAAMYQSVGLHDKAIAEHTRCLKIFQAKFGEQSLDAARSMSNLAAIASEERDFAAAEALFGMILSIREVKLGAEHPDVAQTLLTMGLMLQKQQKFSEARAALLRCIKIRTAVFGEDSTAVADCYWAMGLLESREGNLEAAEKWYGRTASIREKAFPSEHPQRTTLHASLGSLHAAQQRWEQALEDYDQTRRGMRIYTNQVLPGLADNEQLTFLKETDEPALHAALQLVALNPELPEATTKSFEWVLNGKAVSQQSIAERALLARDVSNVKLAKKANDLQQVRKRLATAVNVIDGKVSVQEVDALRRKEAELSQQLSAAAGRPLPVAWLSLDELRRQLPSGSCFISMLRIHAYDYRLGELDRESPGRYLAWMVSSKSDGVRFIDLGDAQAIDDAVRAARSELAEAIPKITAEGEASAEQLLQPSLEKLSTLVLRPLLQHVDSEQLLLSPDSSLWLVPWCALPIHDQTYAIEKYTIQYLVSGRELMETKAEQLTLAAMLFASPAYDLDPNAIRVATQTVFRRTPTSGPPIQSVASRFGTVSPLPYTKTEALAVQPKVMELTEQKPLLYTEEYALEAVFKAARSPKILMLSTHGFFQDPKAITNSRTNNPLLGCGLMLAGCNRPPSLITADTEDGILSGLEIVATDLRGTELVVLSACETGLGEIRNGEGVAGLRQAFQLAGAQAVISTLWQIPDRDSAIIVTDFFDNRTLGKANAAALRDAQVKRIESRRQRQGAAHPFFWGAWTFTGR